MTGGNMLVGHNDLDDDDDDDDNDDDDDDDTRYAPASTLRTASQPMVHALAHPAGLESFANNLVGRGGEMLFIMILNIMTQQASLICDLFSKRENTNKKFSGSVLQDCWVQKCCMFKFCDKNDTF